MGLDLMYACWIWRLYHVLFRGLCPVGHDMHMSVLFLYIGLDFSSFP